MKSKLIKACLFLSMLMLPATATHAIIVLDVSGGTGVSPLVVNVSSVTDSFTASETVSNATLTLRLIDFWDNSAISINSDQTTETLGLGGSSGVRLAGAISGGPFSPSDLIIQFDEGATTDGETFSLTTGTLVTGEMSLNYTAINPTGKVEVYYSTSFLISDQLDYSVNAVPESGAWTTILGLFVSLCMVTRRRSKLL